MLKEYERNGRNESFGVEAAKTGVKKAGFDKYGGNDRYMSEMNPQTRQMLDEFYAGGRRRLVHMMGRHMY